MKILKIKDISKIYYKDNSEFYANNNINLDINSGDIIGLLGKNGAGKTTLIKIICNLIKPDNGQVFIKNKPIEKNPQIVHENIGVVLEGARNLYNFLTVEYNLMYFSYLNKIDNDKLENRIEELLDLFELKDKRNEVVNNLSRGMQQKVAIIVAMLKNPEILILDEPTLGLDIVSKTKMKNLLKDLKNKYGKTIIVSSHDLDVIEDICNKVVIFEKGKILKYSNLSELKFNGEDDSYELTLNSEAEKYILNYKYEKEDGVIRVESKNLDDILSKIKTKNILKIEKKSVKIEELFR